MGHLGGHLQCGQHQQLQHQRGLTLVGLIFILMIAAFLALLAAKMLPAYLEFFAIQRIVGEITTSGEAQNGSVKSIQASFDRRATIESITSIRGADLAIEKDGNGFSISASWERRVPLIHNVSALVEFEVQS